jgi:hypothetical protein
VLARHRPDRAGGSLDELGFEVVETLGPTAPLDQVVELLSEVVDRLANRLTADVLLDEEVEQAGQAAQGAERRVRGHVAMMRMGV